MSLSTGADRPDQITHAFVLKGFDLVYSMLGGERDDQGKILASKHIENRHGRIAPGFYAVLCGRGTKGVTKERYDRCKTTLPSMFILNWCDPNIKHMLGKIVGVVRISHSLPYELCKNDPWAEGPVCNIISHAAWFVSAIPCRGNLGAFPIPVECLADVRSQASTASISPTKGPQLHPYRGPDVWSKKRKKGCIDLGDKDEVALLRRFLLKSQEDLHSKLATFEQPAPASAPMK